MTDDLPAQRPTFSEAGVDMRRFGYFAKASADNDADWARFQGLLDALKSGDFSAGEPMLQLSRQTRHWRLKLAATRCLGHAGTVECFKQMRDEIDQVLLLQEAQLDMASCDLVLQYSSAFAAWGRLDVVPVLVHYYLELRRRNAHEIALLPLLIADLLTDDPASMMAHEPPEDRLDDYLNLVMNRFDECVADLGSDKVAVFRGKVRSVVDIAQRMRRPRPTDIAGDLKALRSCFEPSTGIDCSAIFSSGAVSPLAAAAIAETFLESGQAADYVPGMRYFFGKLIPN